MSAIDISTPKTTLNTGVLQLQNGVAMDATLRNVADQSNTISPLKLSTASVQVTSTLQITTNDNPYIDAEDGAGNNRFTIGRAPSSQQVNVDFASNPTGSTTTVGAIRTYVDGVNLSEIMSFREDGNVGIGTTTPIASALNVEIPITGSAISDRINLYLSSSLTSAGLKLSASNGGSWIQSTQGANGNTTYRLNLNPFGESVNVGTTSNLSASLGIRGSGSTSATTSLLVQNSGGNTALQVKDDLSVSTGAGMSVGAGLIVTGSINIGTNQSIGDGNFNINVNRLQSYNSYTIETLVQNRSVALNSGGLPVLYANYYAGTNIAGVVVQDTVGSSQSTSAVLQVESTTRGFLPPRMTTAQKNAIATPAAGLMVYDTTLNKLCVYTTAWETITSI